MADTELNIGIYIDGEFKGVDNERACDLIERAVEYGVKTNGGKKEAFSLMLASVWLDGYLSVACHDENVIRVMRESMQHYFFI
jgi:hypothetical protein